MSEGILVSKPLLTIAIPTYNRATDLSNLLSSLANQVFSESNVELIISDNASTDETSYVVRSFQSQGLHCKYVCNKSNLGADANILQCYDLAAGKYVWIFGDDDLLKPNAIRSVLSHIEDGQEYDLIYVESAPFNGVYVPSHPLRGNSNVAVFVQVESLARYVGPFFTFLSGNIINKARVESIPHRPFEKLLGTHLVQLAWIYSALEHHQRSLVLRDRLVAVQTDNRGGYGLFTVFGTNLKRITDEWITLSKVKQPILNKTILEIYPHYLLPFKRKKLFFDEESPDSILRPAFRDNFRYWFFILPVMKLPVPFDWAWVIITRFINKIDKLTGRYLIR